MSALTHSIAIGDLVVLADRQHSKRRRRFVLLGKLPECGQKLRPTLAAGDILDGGVVLDHGAADETVLAELWRKLQELDKGGAS